MADTSKCNGCIYWRSITGCRGSQKACHYLLETEKMRKRDESGCLSRKTRREERREQNADNRAEY